ncbi:uncharacterized protein LOC113507414 isoform X2 [Trichoplusia ni]|uniref:Uncharacterized protein LOC113507414 isoform X2 n=1 Tax=Trichoplusia ni TaxID=7111 RepID=A0A7E5WYX8_TRINI|nr:uncharacterized protein LOC113507414 isoform X2 [Trichoplusia ni]
MSWLSTQAGDDDGRLEGWLALEPDRAVPVPAEQDAPAQAPPQPVDDDDDSDDHHEEHVIVRQVAAANYDIDDADDEGGDQDDLQNRNVGMGFHHGPGAVNRRLEVEVWNMLVRGLEAYRFGIPIILVPTLTNGHRLPPICTHHRRTYRPSNDFVRQRVRLTSTSSDSSDSESGTEMVTNNKWKNNKQRQHDSDSDDTSSESSQSDSSTSTCSNSTVHRGRESSSSSSGSSSACDGSDTEDHSSSSSSCSGPSNVPNVENNQIALAERNDPKPEVIEEDPNLDIRDVEDLPADEDLPVNPSSDYNEIELRIAENIENERREREYMRQCQQKNQLSDSEPSSDEAHGNTVKQVDLDVPINDDKIGQVNLSDDDASEEDMSCDRTNQMSVCVEPENIEPPKVESAAAEQGSGVVNAFAIVIEEPETIIYAAVTTEQANGNLTGNAAENANPDPFPPLPSPSRGGPNCVMILRPLIRINYRNFY